MISLRDIQEDDCDLLLAWRNLPHVRRWMFTDHRITAEEHRSWFARTIADPTRRYWLITVDGREVGVVNLTEIDQANERCNWAFYIAEESVRGLGIGTTTGALVLQYAFESYRLERVWCEALSTNTRALAMYARLGFRQEGLLRRHIVKTDGPHDVVVMGLLRDEWSPGGWESRGFKASGETS